MRNLADWAKIGGDPYLTNGELDYIRGNHSTDAEDLIIKSFNFIKGDMERGEFDAAIATIKNIGGGDNGALIQRFIECIENRRTLRDKEMMKLKTGFLQLTSSASANAILNSNDSI